MPQPGDNWISPEVEATVADYLAMLAAELRGDDYSKAEHNRNLRRFVRKRAQFFALPGSLRKSCHHEPDQFLGRLV